jgi:peroxiredoxin Q/BCP
MYLVGVMFNNVLPFRAGDLGRSDLLKREHKVSRVHGYSTVMLEGLLNGLSVLPILFCALLFFPLKPSIEHIFLPFTLLVILSMGVVFFIAQKSEHRWLKGFQAFKKPKFFFYSFGYLFLGWIFYLSSLTCALRACGLSPSFWASPVLAISLAASMFLPSPPGRLGTFEATIVLSLALFNISKETALGFALILHATQTFPAIVWGWVAWWMIGKNRKEKMMPLKTGNPSPNFETLTTTGTPFKMSDRKGKWTVLYFYPKDDTPGCTKQACAFRDSIDEIRKESAEVFGISKDTVQSHKAFSDKFHLNFPLLADPEGKIIEMFGVKGLMGFAKRWTFIIDPELKVRSIRTDVDPALDAKQVAEEIQKFKM